MRQVTRINPVGPPQAYQTYQVHTPKTHMRAATCEEVECPNYLRGFKIAVAHDDQRRIHLIKTSGKPYTVEDGESGVRYAVFAAGTHCFKEMTHRVAVGPELYIVKGGDWRGNPTGRVRQHVKAADWVEDFATHQDRIATELKRG